MAAASELPISIIFLGIGNSDFKLFSDFNSESPFDNASRSNVSFLEFREIDKLDFSQALLHKVPEQVLKWMDDNGITPRQIDSSPEVRDLASSLLTKYDILFGNSDNILKALASAKGPALSSRPTSIFTKRMSVESRRRSMSLASPIKSAEGERRNMQRRLNSVSPTHPTIEETKSMSLPKVNLLKAYPVVTPPGSPHSKTIDIEETDTIGRGLSNSFRTKMNTTLAEIVKGMSRNDKNTRDIQTSLDTLVNTMDSIDRRLQRIEEAMEKK